MVVPMTRARHFGVYIRAPDFWKLPHRHDDLKSWRYGPGQTPRGFQKALFVGSGPSEIFAKQELHMPSSPCSMAGLPNLNIDMRHLFFCLEAQRVHVTVLALKAPLYPVCSQVHICAILRFGPLGKVLCSGFEVA